MIMKSKAGTATTGSSSAEVDARIEGLGDWRGAMLARLRAVIKQADPEVVEECKWKKPSNPSGVPVWSHDGMICTGETHKSVVKMTFAKGAFLDDPAGLFNSSLEGNLRRAIDFHEGDKVNEKALKALIRAAVQLNKSGGLRIDAFPCLRSGTWGTPALGSCFPTHDCVMDGAPSLMEGESAHPPSDRPQSNLVHCGPL